MPRARQTITHLPVEQLTANPANVREDLGDLTDLARSIHEQGILEPLIVTEHPGHGFLLLDGHRRLGAGLRLGLSTYPAIIRHDVTDRAEQTITMLATDVHKKKFTPIERARAYDALKREGLSGSEIARRLGIHPATVTYYLNLLRLDDETQQLVDEGKLPVAEAVATVVQTRQAERAEQGLPTRGRPAPHFGLNHPLADAAASRCRSHGGHTPSYGGVACGNCWEQTVRADAATAQDGAA
jgi:ParB family transcriptional regulator, chromosome partitioning protein